MADSTALETFPNPRPNRDYLIEHWAEEFTSLCPKTGQPDFARVRIRYVAGPKCIELRSLKLYLQGFRTRGIFYEEVTNVILEVLAGACEPRWISVETHWSIRGGIRSVIAAQIGDPELAQGYCQNAADADTGE